MSPSSAARLRIRLTKPIPSAAVSRPELIVLPVDPARDSIVMGPGSEILAGAEFTTQINPTLVPVDPIDYISGIEYLNGSIQAIYHAEGWAVPDGSTWRHEYVLADHLGNTRLRFSDVDGNGTLDSTELLSTHDYYPFGME